MKPYQWDEDKNQLLKEQRGVSFEDVLDALENGKLLKVLEGNGDYSHQKRYIVNINNYPYVVPYVEDEHKRFLKTIFPNRKLKYLINE